MKNFFDINEINKLLFKENNTASTPNQSTSQTQNNILNINWSFLANFFANTNSQDSDTPQASAIFSFNPPSNQQNNSSPLNQHANFAPPKREPAANFAPPKYETTPDRYSPDNFLPFPSLSSLPKFGANSEEITQSNITIYPLSSLSRHSEAQNKTPMPASSSMPIISLQDIPAYSPAQSQYSGSIYAPSLRTNIDDDTSSQTSKFSLRTPSSTKAPSLRSSPSQISAAPTILKNTHDQETTTTPISSSPNNPNPSKSWSAMISSSLSSLVNTLSFWKKSPSHNTKTNTADNSTSYHLNSPKSSDFLTTSPKSQIPIQASSPSPVAFFGDAAKQHDLYHKIIQHQEKHPLKPFSFPRGSTPDRGKLPSQSKSPTPCPKTRRQHQHSQSKSPFTHAPSSKYSQIG